MGEDQQQWLDQLAIRQLADYDSGRPGSAFAETIQLTEQQAYQVQAAVAASRHQRGEALAGYKVGCTSAVIQRQLGIDRAILGRLFESEQYVSGVQLCREQFDHLAIEGELAVLLAVDLEPGKHLTDSQLKESFAAVFPVIELHNYLFRAAAPTAAEIIANNGLQAGFVVPKSIQIAPLSESSEPCLTIRIDGQEVDAYQGKELIDNLYRSVRFLSGVLADRGEALKAGQIVLTGSLPSLILVERCQLVEVDAPGFGFVQAKFTDRAEPAG